MKPSACNVLEEGKWIETKINFEKKTKEIKWVHNMHFVLWLCRSTNASYFIKQIGFTNQLLFKIFYRGFSLFFVWSVSRAIDIGIKFCITIFFHFRTLRILFGEKKWSPNWNGNKFSSHLDFIVIARFLNYCRQNSPYNECRGDP